MAIKKYLIPFLILSGLPVAADVPLGTDIVLLGEVHDNPDAHLGQAAAIQALQPTAVVFEMFSPEDAVRANLDRATLPEIWSAMSWPDYAIYQPIFDALGNATIVGAAASRDTTRAVFENGAASVFGAEASRFGLDLALPADQQAKREELQFEAHCEAMPKEMMSGMVEVQRFRDALFAKAAIEALETYGPLVVVVTGNGHARADWGIPVFIKNAKPEATTFSIAFSESVLNASFDKVHIVPEAERSDPCAAFKKS